MLEQLTTYPDFADYNREVFEQGRKMFDDLHKNDTEVSFNLKVYEVERGTSTSITHATYMKTIDANRSSKVGRYIRSPRLVRTKHEHIAKAVAGLFMKKGYVRTTMRQIAAAAGMAMGNLYEYISKKEDILYLVLNNCQACRQNDLYKEDILVRDGPKETLRLFISRLLNDKVRFADEMRLIYYESLFLPGNAYEEIMMKEIEQVRRLERIIQSGIDSGVFKSRDPYLTADMIISQLSMLAVKHWMFQQQYPMEKLDALIEDHILSTIIS